MEPVVYWQEVAEDVHVYLEIPESPFVWVAKLQYLSSDGQPESENLKAFAESDREKAILFASGFPLDEDEHVEIRPLELG